MSSNQIINFASALSNAQKSLKNSFFWPRTKVILEILRILRKEGFVSHFKSCRYRGKESFEIFLKHSDDSETSKSFKLVSKPSLEKYFSKNDVWKFSTNVGIFILSTPFGILSDREAKQLCTGGKVLLYVS